MTGSQNFIMGSDTPELALSVESRSSVNRVNDQVRKRQKRIFNFTGWRRTFCDLVNVYGCNHGISGIHGKNYQNNCNYNAIATGLTLEQNVRHIYEIGVRTR